jgi:hypothetical protein
MTAPAFDVGFTLNIRHSFDSSARQFQATSGLMQRSSFGKIRRLRGLLVSSKRAECGNFIGDRAFMHCLVLAANLRT